MPFTDQADVLAAFDGLFQALLARRDAEAGTRLFVDDPSAVMWGSEQDERATGRAEIAALDQGIADYPGVLRFRWHERHAHMDGDVAWVNADGDVTVSPVGAAPQTTPYRLTAVLVRRDGEWHWHTFNGSEPNGAPLVAAAALDERRKRRPGARLAGEARASPFGSETTRTLPRIVAREIEGDVLDVFDAVFDAPMSRDRLHAILGR
jgi:ketosteroid isomerase-like protein